MSRHTITLQELDDYLSVETWHLAASSHGTGTSKRLETSNDGAFRVTDHGEIIYAGDDMAAAVDAYNRAR